jgi:hypothetical protein
LHDDNDNDEQNLLQKKDKYSLAVIYVGRRAEIQNDIKQKKNFLGHDEDWQRYLKWIDDSILNLHLFQLYGHNHSFFSKEINYNNYLFFD